MKKLHKITNILCIIMILAVLTASMVYAESNNADIKENNKTTYIVGDTNGNGLVTISDASLAQEYLSKIIALNNGHIKRADTNRDGELDINDVTAIQAWCNGVHKNMTRNINIEIGCDEHRFTTKTHKSEQINAGTFKTIEVEKTRTAYKAEEHGQCSNCKKDLTILTREYNAANGTHLSVTQYINRIHNPYNPVTKTRDGCGYAASDILIVYIEYEETYIDVCRVPADPLYYKTTYDECELCGRIEHVNKIVVDDNNNEVTDSGY